jgi:hypothetical protein
VLRSESDLSDAYNFAMGSMSFRGPLLSLSRWLVIAAFALRILVPVGYMPSAVSGGWFLQLCPDGLSAHVMTRLLGGAHAHHHLHQVGETSAAKPLQCDLGSALSAELGKAETLALIPVGASEPPQTFGESSPADSLLLHAFRSRAPPVLAMDPA